MALSSAKRLFEPAYVRTMFVRVSPVPRNLSERRAVLRALQKYGEIEVFKRLIDPASFVSTAKQSSTLERLVGNSPFQFDVVTEKTNDAAVSHLTENMPGRDAEPCGEVRSALANDQLDGPRAGRKTFSLHIFPAENYKHKTMIRHSPLHGPWPDERRSSFVTAALRLALGKHMAARSLYDWETGGQSDKGARRPPEKTDHIQERMQRRERRTRTKSLHGFQSRSPVAGTTEGGYDLSV